jgi:hypothetical protein
LVFFTNLGQEERILEEKYMLLRRVNREAGQRGQVERRSEQIGEVDSEGQVISSDWLEKR